MEKNIFIVRLVGLGSLFLGSLRSSLCSLPGMHPEISEQGQGYLYGRIGTNTSLYNILPIYIKASLRGYAS